MERIPVIPVTSDMYRELNVGKVWFDGITPKLEKERISFSEAVEKVRNPDGERGKVLLLDVKSLQSRSINEKLLKNLKIRGMETWYLTCIERVDDVFDAFNTDAEYVLMPLHLIEDDTELIDIVEVSDSAIPMIFVRNGKAVKRESDEDLVETARSIFEKGYFTISVFDVDGSVSDAQWNELLSMGNIIPFSKKELDTEYSLFSDYI